MVPESNAGPPVNNHFDTRVLSDCSSNIYQNLEIITAINYEEVGIVPASYNFIENTLVVREGTLNVFSPLGIYYESNTALINFTHNRINTKMRCTNTLGVLIGTSGGMPH